MVRGMCSRGSMRHVPNWHHKKETGKIWRKRGWIELKHKHKPRKSQERDWIVWKKACSFHNPRNYMEFSKDLGQPRPSSLPSLCLSECTITFCSKSCHYHLKLLLHECPWNYFPITLLKNLFPPLALLLRGSVWGYWCPIPRQALYKALDKKQTNKIMNLRDGALSAKTVILLGQRNQ